MSCYPNQFPPPDTCSHKAPASFLRQHRFASCYTQLLKKTDASDVNIEPTYSVGALRIALSGGMERTTWIDQDALAIFSMVRFWLAVRSLARRMQKR